MSNPFEAGMFPEIELTQDVLPRVPLQDVLDIQSLAMGTVRPISQTRRSSIDPKFTGFVLLHETSPRAQNVGDLIQMPDEYGEYDDFDIDTYLGVIVRKPQPREWRLTVSFLQYALKDDERFSNVRDMYRFEWRRGDDEALGTRRIIRSVGKALENEQVDTDNALSFEHAVQSTRTTEVAPVWKEDCVELRNKIAAHINFFLGLDANFTAA